MTELEAVLFRTLVGPVQVVHVLIAIGVLTVIVPLTSYFARLRDVKKTEQQMVHKRCGSCGWNGKVSKHARRCPSCNQTLA